RGECLRNSLMEPFMNMRWMLLAFAATTTLGCQALHQELTGSDPTGGASIPVQVGQPVNVTPAPTPTPAAPAPTPSAQPTPAPTPPPPTGTNAATDHVRVGPPGLS